MSWLQGVRVHCPPPLNIPSPPGLHPSRSATQHRGQSHFVLQAPIKPVCSEPSSQLSEGKASPYHSLWVLSLVLLWPHSLPPSSLPTVLSSAWLSPSSLFCFIWFLSLLLGPHSDAICRAWPFLGTPLKDHSLTYHFLCDFSVTAYTTTKLCVSRVCESVCVPVGVQVHICVHGSWRLLSAGDSWDPPHFF